MPHINIKRRQLIELHNAINAAARLEVDRKTAWVLARTMVSIKPSIDALADVTKPLAPFVEAHTALMREMAKTDDAGTPIGNPNGGGYFVPDMVEFNRRVEVLKAEFGQDKRDAEVEALLDESERVYVESIEFERLPDPIDPFILRGLLPIVLDPVTDSDKGPTEQPRLIE